MIPHPANPAGPAPELGLFVTSPPNLESLLAEELLGLGGKDIAVKRAGVAVRGSLELAYRVCLWSRLASRVLLPLAEFPAATPDELYEGVHAVDWTLHLSSGGTLAVDVTGHAGPALSPRFAALKSKDAVVDHLRALTGSRPSVDTRRPDVRLNLHLERGRGTLSLDLSGESLHRRHYREEGVQGEAPLKENLAAGVLVRAGWPEAAGQGLTFLDPLCGSGTLPIEAALMAADTAPGLLRPWFGFLGWLGHVPRIWTELLQDARERRSAGLRSVPPIIGYDADPGAVRMALANVERAGLTGIVHVERRDIDRLEPPARATSGGLLIANPPYGRRLGEEKELARLYGELGQRLREAFAGWRVALLTANPDLARETRLRADRYYTLYNGALEVKLFLFRVDPAAFVRPAKAPAAGAEGTTAEAAPNAEQVRAARAAAGMFANRLRKNLRHLGRWARREGVTCFRVYDADIPEYAVAVDLYEEWVHVQEYEAPEDIDPRRARERLAEVLLAVPAVLQIPAENVYLKVRRRQRGLSQYEKLAGEGRFHEVREGGLRFLVNFTDYLDTGLFLDHRPTRALVRELAAGRRLLNLFGYTGTATVYAAAGGARETVTVDLSHTYLDWARRNLELNGFVGREHQLVRADVLAWLGEQQREQYDLVFLDPPTFSSSKAMEAAFDIQRDHVELIREAARLLGPEGQLIFSTNFRRFKLRREDLVDLEVVDITRRTIPPDFARNPRIHQTFTISRKVR